MRLGIISDAPHYYDKAGRLNTLTLVARQFEQWAEMFYEVIICAPLWEGVSPSTHSPYQVENIRLMPISPAGGNTLAAKMDLFKKSIVWFRTVRKLLKQVDAVHIRCPNNISILGLILLEASPVLRQAVFTGNWLGYSKEPMTYWAQRMFLKYRFHGPVAVYGSWPNQPRHIVPSFSPSYSLQDWHQEAEQVVERIRLLNEFVHLPLPIELLSVGHLDKNKNQRMVLEAVKILADQNIECRLSLLGDGPQREPLLQEAKRLGIDSWVNFHGKVSQDVVRGFYRKSSFVIQPSYTEGYSKVPVEALFHGAIPILSDVSTNSEIVGYGSRGRYFSIDHVQSIADHISDLSYHPSDMIQMIENGRVYARTVTLEAWQQHLHWMLTEHWKINLPKPRLVNSDIFI